MRSSQITMVVIGVPVAVVLFALFMVVGAVLAVPIFLLTLLAAGAAGLIGALAGLGALIYYAARDEKHAPDPGNYSLDQTKSADEN